MRTHKLALESRLGEKLDVQEVIMTWLIENSADILNKCQVGRDGKTPYERLKCKRHSGEFLEFGSRILHRIPAKPQGGLLAPRWLDGLWLGKRFTTDEHIVADTDGKGSAY